MDKKELYNHILILSMVLRKQQ